MPANIEIKAILRDRARAEAVAARLSGGTPELIRQEDVFFRCEGARLKLRIFGPDRAELIRYQRSDRAELRRSEYSIARTSDPRALLEILSRTLGTTGVVKKERTLFLVGQTRVHLDRVEGLGDFLELEVVLRDGQSDTEGREIAAALLAEIGVGEDELLAKAYVDLLSGGRE